MGRLVDKINQLISFGDSFVFGNELSDNSDGSRAWPALAAARLKLIYHTCAVPGCGNEHIAQQFFTYAAEHDLSKSLVVINWTWMMRWDFYLAQQRAWVALGPTCTPEKLQDYLGREQAHKLLDFYQHNLMDSEIWSRNRSMMAMFAVNQYLEQHNIVSVQTYMDYDLFADPVAHYQAYKEPSWPMVHNQDQLHSLPSAIGQECQTQFRNAMLPGHLMFMQSWLQPRMLTWDGLNFVDWAKQQGYPVSDRLHPLECAHQNAVDFWIDEYRHRCYAR